MRYHVFATDYDGTIATHSKVSAETIAMLQKLKATHRVLVLVTGRELNDLEKVFPEYKVFDYIVAENGALIHYTANGKEELLGQKPPQSFVEVLHRKGVAPLSVGKVIVATWEPHEKAVLEAIKESGLEHQVIFNKGAVMILPPGVNKATGLQALLKMLCLSIHNTVAVGDAENDSAMLQVAEYAVAVNNALPSLKTIADYTTGAPNGEGVQELAALILENEHAGINHKLVRHHLQVGLLPNNEPFTICPYRSGILLSGVSGAGKSTFTLSIIESLVTRGYQFCLVDPEGDYLELPGTVVTGNEKTLPALEEISELLKNPEQNIVICTLSVPLPDRPAFFAKLLPLLMELRKDYGHPHWILLDEAHHLMPPEITTAEHTIPGKLVNFVLITTSPHALHEAILSQIGMVITIGENPRYPIEQFCSIRKCVMPEHIPDLSQGQACVWDIEHDKPPFVIQVNMPVRLMQRHKKKYAAGDMGDNSFVFTGLENKLQLKANNLLMFVHLAEGIDDATWLYHLHREDYRRWVADCIHDDELAEKVKEAEKKDVAASKKIIIDSIKEKYTL